MQREKARPSLACQDSEAVDSGRNNSRIGAFATKNVLRKEPQRIHPGTSAVTKLVDKKTHTLSSKKGSLLLLNKTWLWNAGPSPALRNRGASRKTQRP